MHLCCFLGPDITPHASWKIGTPRVFGFATPYVLLINWCRKSSAKCLVSRVFSQKGFEVSFLGHTFMSDSQKFFESCAKLFQNITN